MECFFVYYFDGYFRRVLSTQLCHRFFKMKEHLMWQNLVLRWSLASLYIHFTFCVWDCPLPWQEGVTPYGNSGVCLGFCPQVDAITDKFMEFLVVANKEWQITTELNHIYESRLNILYYLTYLSQAELEC